MSDVISGLSFKLWNVTVSVIAKRTPLPHEFMPDGRLTGLVVAPNLLEAASAGLDWIARELEKYAERDKLSAHVVAVSRHERDNVVLSAATVRSVRGDERAPTDAVLVPPEPHD